MSNRHDGPPDGAEDLELEDIYDANADIDQYRREAYGSGSRHDTFRDRDEESYASERYRRTDQTRLERAGGKKQSALRDDAVEGEQQSASGQHQAQSIEERQRDLARTGEAGAPMPPAPKKSKGKRVAIAVVAVVAVLVLVGAGVAFAYMNNVVGNLHEGVDQELRESLVKTDMAKEPFYVLLLGTDQSAQRDEEGELDGIYRSDSIMLARIDPVNKKATLVSIPRDTKVDLGEYGIQKINAARAIGGPAMAVEAVSKLTGVDISHFAEINFDGFQAIVDALGGVEVEVPIEIDDWDAGGYVPAGLQTLDGEHALIVCRSRMSYADTAADPDYMRTANQRLVLSAIAHKILSSDVATIANTVAAVSEFVTTDLEINDIIGIAQTMKGLDPASDIYTGTFPGRSEYIMESQGAPEGWYEIPDEAAWAEMKKRMEQGLPPSESALIDEKTGTVLATAGEGAVDTSEKTAVVDVKNGTDRDGLANHAKKLLNDAGFVNVVASTAADAFDYPATLVVYDNPAQAYEAGLIVDALGQGKAMVNDGTYVFDADFLVVIGEDWKGGDSGSAGSSSSAAA